MSLYLKGANKHIGGIQVGVLEKDLGANFANAATEFTALGFDSPFALAVLKNTNGTGAGSRLYIKANGVVTYVALT